MTFRARIAGQFKIDVQRADGRRELIVSNNSLTIRGAIEFIARQCALNPIASTDGGQLNDAGNLNSVAFRTIDDDNFVALNREDRVAYYDPSTGVEILGDNRQWSFEDNDEPNWGQFRADAINGTWDQYPYPRLFDTYVLPYSGYHPDLDITTVRFKSFPHRQNEPATWRGIALTNNDAGFLGTKRVHAVLASAVLPETLVVGPNDWTTLYYTLSITPSFP